MRILGVIYNPVQIQTDTYVFKTQESFTDQTLANVQGRTYYASVFFQRCQMESKINIWYSSKLRVQADRNVRWPGSIKEPTHDLEFARAKLGCS